MPAGIFLTTLIIYLRTLCGSYDIVDGAEMLGAGWSLGPAHPPGYPLPLLVIKLTSVLPVGSPGFRANLLAAAGMALAAAVLWKLASSFAGSRIAGVLGLAAAVHWTLWQQALSVKGGIYAWLTAAAAAAVLIPASGAGALPRLALLLGVTAALQPQGATVVAIAGLAAFASTRASRKAFRPRSLAMAAALAALGVSLYLVLPIRSAAAPPFHWGVWHSWQGLIALAKWSGGSVTSTHAGFGFAESYPFKRGILVLLALALTGCLAGRHAGLTPATAASGAATAVASFLLMVPIDIFGGFFQHAVLVWVGGVAGAAGWCRFLSARGRTTRRLMPRAVAALGVCLTGAGLLSSRAPDWSRYYLIDDFARNAFAALPAGRGILLCFGDYSWDACRLRQTVFGDRPDVALVHLAILGTRAYGPHLTRVTRDHPWLAAAPLGNLSPQQWAGVRIQRAGREPWGAWFDPYFFVEMSRYEPLPVPIIPSGFGGIFGEHRDDGTAMRRMLRGRLRGLWSVAGTPDRWNRYLPVVYGHAFNEAARHAVLNAKATPERSRALREVFRLLGRKKD